MRRTANPEVSVQIWVGTPRQHGTNSYPGHETSKMLGDESLCASRAHEKNIHGAIFGDVAQLVEQVLHTDKVGGA